MTNISNLNCTMAAALALLVSVAAAGVADAKPGNKGGGRQDEQKGGHSQTRHESQSDRHETGRIGFRETERQQISDYFRQRPYFYHGGTEALPPGIRKKLARGGTLPPGIAKQYLPRGLEGQLPLRAGLERVIHGEDVYLVQRGSNVILDVLEGVLRTSRR